MFRLIVVPLDGTPFAEYAVPTAVMLARAGRGRLLVVRVHVPPPPVNEVQGVVLVDGAMLQEIEAAARDSLDEVARRVAAHAGVPVDAALVTAATPHHALHDVAAERGADLIVMTSHHRSALGRFFAGSVAERVAREPGIPVLVVHGSDAQQEAEHAAGLTSGPAEPFRRVLIPLDGSLVAEAVLESATRLARVCGAAVTLVTVRDPFLAAAGLPQHAARPEYLEEVARRLREAGFAVDVRETEDRNPARAIARCATEVGADVIAMSTHGRSGVARLLAGSVAAGVLHAVLTPVLVLHPDEDAAPDASDVADMPNVVPPPA